MPTRKGRLSIFSAFGVLVLLILAVNPSTDHSASASPVTSGVAQSAGSSKWTALNISGPPVTVQTGPAFLTYSPPDHGVLLLMSDRTQAHTYTWLFHNSSWTNLTPGLRVSPPPVIDGLVYDASDGYDVAFVANQPLTVPSTWAFQNGSWINLTKGTQPPAVYRGTVVYDASAGYVVLYGGCCVFTKKGSSFLNQTWSFHNGSWTKLSTVKVPPEQYDISGAYDAQDGRVFLFGGLRHVSRGVQPGFNTTWQFSGGSWRGHTYVPSPSDRQSSALAYDPSRKALVLVGGYTGANLDYDTWTFNGKVWSNISTSVGTSPAIGWPSSMAFDEADGELVAIDAYGVTWVLP